jgi:membrane-associated phospholipid phosphatase
MLRAPASPARNPKNQDGEGERRMNPFDRTILDAAAQVSGAWPGFDLFVVFLTSNDLFKGFLVMGAIWWLWFRDTLRPASTAPDPAVREQVMATLLAGLVALVLARGLAETLPFRMRPLALPEYANEFTLSRERLVGLEEWSSFPSDHATLFSALAAGAWFACRRLGTILLVYTFIVILAPRVYLGMHYPTDVLAGALIGVGIAWAAHLLPIRHLVSRPFLLWQVRSPGTFYASAFLLTSQIAVLFDPVRRAARFAAELTSSSL